MNKNNKAFQSRIICLVGVIIAASYYLFTAGSLLWSDFSIYDLLESSGDENVMIFCFAVQMALSVLAGVAVLVAQNPNIVNGLVTVTCIAYIGADIYLINEIGEMLSVFYINFVGLVIMAIGAYSLNEVLEYEYMESKAYVECISGEFKGAVIEITDDIVVKIGRNANECNLVLSDKKCSSIHCQIRYDSTKKKYIVKDSSTNGTFLETNERLEKDADIYLPKGSTIYLVTKKESFKLN